MSKTVCVLVWLVPLRNGGQVIRWCCCQYSHQVGVHLDFERRTGLLLLHRNLPAGNMLLAHTNQIGAEGNVVTAVGG